MFFSDNTSAGRLRTGPGNRFLLAHNSLIAFQKSRDRRDANITAGVTKFSSNLFRVSIVRCTSIGTSKLELN